MKVEKILDYLIEREKMHDKKLKDQIDYTADRITMYSILKTINGWQYAPSCCDARRMTAVGWEYSEKSIVENDKTWEIMPDDILFRDAMTRYNETKRMP